MKKLSVNETFAICMIMLLISYVVSYNLPRWLDKSSSEPSRGHVTATLGEEPDEKTFSILTNTNQRVPLTPREFNCLSRNIYHEAKFEGYIGKIAVANVTYNRLKQQHWGKTMCKVVYRKNQFSWTKFRRMREERPHGQSWVQAKDAAAAFARGVRVTTLAKADHYHGDYIEAPGWSKDMFVRAHIGKHIFYSQR